MSNEERTGFRSLIYSRWHRPSNVKRFLGPVRAARLLMIDVDCLEYCICGRLVALIETERTNRATPKNAPVTALLARLAGIPAFSVAYSGDINRTHCEVCGEDREAGEIELFRVRQLVPKDHWIGAKTPQEYAHWLLSLRDGHDCTAQQEVAA